MWKRRGDILRLQPDVPNVEAEERALLILGNSAPAWKGPLLDVYACFLSRSARVRCRIEVESVNRMPLVGGTVVQ